MFPRFLFVYGTLRPGATDPGGKMARARLYREARHVGVATVQGALVDLKRYPGLIHEPNASGLVHGDIIRLRAPAATFRWLDPYEGLLPPEGTTDGEYLRIRTTTMAWDGRETHAWTYLYALENACLPRIGTGDWLAR